MLCRNMFLTFLITISAILLQGCVDPGIIYIQGYYDKTLKESEISWIKIGNINIEVAFDGLPTNTPFERVQRRQEYQGFAFPSGERTINVRYYSGSVSGTSFTHWAEITKYLEGGKCYVINDYEDDTGFFSLAPDIHHFMIEECDCTSRISSAQDKKVELYRLSKYEDRPDLKLDLIKTYDLDDNIFSPLRSNNEINIPNEFIRKLFEELE